ncbi:MAG: hypothetical protein ACE5I7_12925 [Candidatus Binatia bacterium]
MDRNELTLLGKRARERLEAALETNDRDAARNACEFLAKEYVLIHKGLRKVLEYAMEYIEGAFREEQAAIARRITEAVRAGDSAQARALLQERDRQHQRIHDQFISMKAGFYSYVGNVFGDQRLEEILRHTGTRQQQGFERWERMSVEEFVRASAHLLKTHMGTVTVLEDEEKYTIVQDPCGSGGRLMREGAYEDPAPLYRIAAAQGMTFGKPNFPSYCAHCAVWNHLQCIEWFGHPQWCIEHPAGPTDPCRLYIYKDRRRIPERFYRQVGKVPGEPEGTPRRTEEDNG